LDLLLLTGIFYTFYSFLVKYRGLRLIAGLSVFIVLWLLAVIFDLSTLTWLFQQIWGIFLFALIVIFQPELRRALQSFSGRGIFYQRYSRAKTIKKVIKAISYMAEKQIGALIVFERSIPVSSLSEGCTKLEAVVSPELLITIFYPLTPLHDGAVIIREGRVLAAGVILPLSTNPLVGRGLGTRHRAALGITEVSDAVAVVVSEETGAISLAVSGRITRGISPATLRKMLSELLGFQSVEPWWRRRLFG